jgi:NitT/TauT family transport system permease protein
MPSHPKNKSKVRHFSGAFFAPFLFIVILTILWQVFSAKFNKFHLFPTPLEVGKAIIQLAKSGAILKHSFSSLIRVFSGFILAAVLAIPLGLFIGTNKILKAAINPPMQFIRTISPIAWIPLAILWFGIGEAPAIFIIFITTVQNTDPILIKVAKNLGASNETLMRNVIFPAILPYIFIALRIAVGIGWVVIVAAEMVGMSSGLGFMILDARNFLRTDIVIAGMIVIGCIGFLIDLAFGLIEKKVKQLYGKTAEDVVLE